MQVRLRNPDRVETVPGPLTVHELLRVLEINPTTALVICGGELVPGPTRLADEAEVEIRPVISGGAGAPKCITCRQPAVIEEPRHRSAWCGPHFIDHVHGQVRKAIDHPGSAVAQERMFSYGDRLLVAVSGGKDSLALWKILLDMGYQADGLYVGLGIGGYSSRSGQLCQDFAAKYAAPRGRELIYVDMEAEYGYTTPSGSQASARPTCAVCGLSKRYIFNRAAVAGEYDVVVTGHNLDDEAATLLGNVLRWQDGFLARQRPLLPSTGPNQPRKVKPLYRLTEREMAAYCVIAGLDYAVEECPLVAGNTGQELKEQLSAMEVKAPGSKAQFLFGFLDKHANKFVESSSESASDEVSLVACSTCEMPTQPSWDDSAPRCAFCRQQDRILTSLGTSRPRPSLPIVSTNSSSPIPEQADA